MMIVIISADHDDEPKDAADKEEEGNADADDADDADNDDFDGLLPVQLAIVVLPTCISISMLSIIAHRLPTPLISAAIHLVDYHWK